MNNKELINAGHALAKAISNDTPLIEIAKMVSNLATQLDVQIARSNQLSIALEAAEKRIAELEAVKFKLSDSKLLSLAKDIVENLVDTGGSDPEYTQQYVDWTCKRIRIAAAGKGE